VKQPEQAETPSVTSRRRGGRPGCTFRIWEEAKLWQVSRDETPYGEFLTRGDAVRAACFGARTAEGEGKASDVLVAPGDQRVPHYEPHFAK
jgi:hypothetical protein